MAYFFCLGLGDTYLLRGGGVLIIGVWGLWGSIVGIEGSPNWIFDSGPVGTESLGMFPVRSLGFWLYYPIGSYFRGEVCYSNSPPPPPLGIKVPRGLVCLGMLDLT